MCASEVSQGSVDSVQQSVPFFAAMGESCVKNLRPEQAHLEGADSDKHLLSSMPAGLNLLVAKGLLCFLPHLQIKPAGVDSISIQPAGIDSSSLLEQFSTGLFLPDALKGPACTSWTGRRQPHIASAYKEQGLGPWQACQVAESAHTESR